MKVLLNCKVIRNRMIVTTNLEKKRPQFSILATLADETKTTKSIRKENKKSESIILYITDAEIQSNSSVRA